MMRSKAGNVYLIGAGPGDPGLMTLKGKDCLGKSDTVLYDALVNPEILNLAKPGSVKIFAGKKGHQSLKQGEINRILAAHAKKGKVVSRLKGGDPFLFGRGGEEAEYLARSGVPFEIVPGVSSLTAVPAYAGIPVTDRRHNSMLTAVTGHSQDNERDAPKVEWDKISKASTLVILMGVSRLSTIVRELRKQGWRKEVPVACIRWGTLPGQEVVESTLGNIESRIKKIPFTPPAVIVIGNVVKLRKKIKWFHPRACPALL